MCILAPTPAAAQQVSPSPGTPTGTATTSIPGAASTSVLGNSPTTAYDQIVGTAQQIANIAADPNMSVDLKTQQINVLTGQFNQAVATWQQQVQMTAASTSALSDPSVTVGGLPTAQPNAFAPGVSGTPSPTPTGITSFTTPTASATPSVIPASAGGQSAADQLRAQIAQVSQQMASVAQDPTLKTDTRAALLSGLAAQFNQLMAQLQQLGG
jgi:hypothetical protein